MFKYIKTIHSHTVAETCRHSVNNNLQVPQGTLCQLSNGYLIHSNNSNKPYYLVIEDKKAEDGKRALDCIRLSPGMMLMGTSEFDLDSLSVGAMCGFTTDQNEYCTQISSNGTDAEVVAIDGELVTIITNK